MKLTAFIQVEVPEPVGKAMLKAKRVDFSMAVPFEDDEGYEYTHWVEAPLDWRPVK
jgi:hypothetical protein